MHRSSSHGSSFSAKSGCSLVRGRELYQLLDKYGSRSMSAGRRRCRHQQPFVGSPSYSGNRSRSTSRHSLMHILTSRHRSMSRGISRGRRNTFSGQLNDIKYAASDDIPGSGDGDIKYAASDDIPGSGDGDIKYAASDDIPGSGDGSPFNSPSDTTDCDDASFVVAIDFGTYASGYAYSHDGAPDEIELNVPWEPADNSVSTTKTPTCLLVDEEGSFLKFGYEAIDQYVNDREDGNSSTHLFRSFKMSLHGRQEWDESLDITAEDGIFKLKALDIFSKALEYLKGHILQAIGRSVTSGIQWVIAVPAIWSEGSKMLMRKAAVKAGIVKAVNSVMLTIALEPEAAALYCRILHRKHLQTTSKVDFGMLEKGERYMVADCGGGTIDIVVHEIQEDNSIKELDEPCGGPWGSAYNDEMFINLLKDLFDIAAKDSFIEHYRQDNQDEWLELMLTFQRKKCAKDLGTGKQLTIEVPTGMSDTYHSYYNKAIKTHLENIAIEGFSFQVKKNRCILKFDHKLYKKKIFNPSVEPCINFVKKKLEQLTNKGIAPSYILMVGGYSQSSFLQKAMVDNFQDKYNVCFLKYPVETVLEGAVIYGYNPQTITGRIAKRSIGFQTNTKYDTEKHKEEKKVFIEDVPYSKDIFRPLVIKGQILQKGTFENILSPATPNQKTMKLSFYSIDRTLSVDNDSNSYIVGDSLNPTTQGTVLYVDDDNVSKIGEISIQLRPYSKDLVHVKVDFSFSEMKITATNETEGNSRSLPITFESQYSPL